MQRNIFFPTVTLWRTLINTRAPPFKRVPVKPRREDVSSQLAVPVTQHAAAPPRLGYLNAVQGVAFVAGRPSISTVKCSALPIHHGAVTSGLTCNKGTTQRYRASERRVAGTTPPSVLLSLFSKWAIEYKYDVWQTFHSSKKIFFNSCHLSN